MGTQNSNKFYQSSHFYMNSALCHHLFLKTYRAGVVNLSIFAVSLHRGTAR